MPCNVRDVPVSHTDYIMQTARWATKTYVPSLLIKMLCNVRDVPVPSYTGYIMQTAKWAIIKYMCRAYTPKCYVICEMYLFFIYRLHHTNSQTGY